MKIANCQKTFLYWFCVHNIYRVVQLHIVDFRSYHHNLTLWVASLIIISCSLATGNVYLHINMMNIKGYLSISIFFLSIFQRARVVHIYQCRFVDIQFNQIQHMHVFLDWISPVSPHHVLHMDLRMNSSIFIRRIKFVERYTCRFFFLGVTATTKTKWSLTPTVCQ